MKKVERNVQVGNIRCWKQKKLVLRNYGALKHVLPALRRESNSRRNNSNKLARKNIWHQIEAIGNGLEQSYQAELNK